MTVFRIKNDRQHYQELTLDSLKLAEQLRTGAESMLPHVMKISDLYHPLADKWQPIKTSFRVRKGFPASVEIPDISVWSCCLVLSERAHGYLNAILQEFGELLPLTIDDEFQFFLFRAMGDVQVDDANSAKTRFDGVPVGIEKLAFVPDSVKDKLIFRSSYEGGGAIFCTQAFVELYREYDLDGVLFDENLTGVDFV